MGNYADYIQSHRLRTTETATISGMDDFLHIPDCHDDLDDGRQDVPIGQIVDEIMADLQTQQRKTA